MSTAQARWAFRARWASGLASFARRKVASGVALGAALFLLWMGAAQAGEDEAAARGEVLFRAGGCAACHTDHPRGGAFLAGGGAIKTPFGTFFAPNITPDPETGIGAWSIADFVRAMTDGIAPDGTTYYPVFPYTSYTKMTRRDLEDLKAYLDTVSPVRRPNQPHDLKWPFGWRFVLEPWRLLYFNAGAFEPDPDRSGEWNRGAYLVAALGHCAECHTPRNLLGGPKSDMALAGSRDGPEGELAPNITPEKETGIGGWSMRSLVSFLRRGFKPDGDDVQGSMALVIEHGLRYLDEADLEAIATYLFTLPPIHNRLQPKKAPAPDPWAE